ncbi:hypothetical protein EKH77_31350 [Streptomyces luteoverticillatus]|uniref:Uncharacterized protein n=1 Tax=Streptomyces luteoverticillatus TaxID=66425 RepID=A0A3S9PRZ0_STRLT|nr:hypothetical protein [Streptomyces luteoverticillatus]AZQ75055.1 hypothetical protein EKH77_31350 [Streptomyces luteoverticillatus]
MHINEEPDRTAGLPADDLAQPTDTGTEERTTPAETPLYPGESTTPEEAEGSGGESATSATDAQGEAGTSTEELRGAPRRYRSFFNRLLST